MLEFKRTLTDDEVNILKHDNVDIEILINNFIDNEIANSLRNVLEEYRGVEVKAKAPTMLVDPIESARALFAMPDYKDKAGKIEEVNKIMK